MLPDHIEYYVNGETSLEVRVFDDHNSYWIKGGIGSLEFKEQDLKDLIDILVAYDREKLRPEGLEE